MSNLDNIISKILKDAEEKASQIVKGATSSANIIMEEMIAEGKKTGEAISAEAAIVAKNEQEKIISGNKLNIRDKILEAKQSAIEHVYEEAVSRLNNLPEDEFLAFVKSVCETSDLTGDEEIIVPQKYKGMDLSGINQSMAEKGKNGNLTIAADEREITGGFIIKSGGVWKNNTFDALISYHRNDVEALVIENLF